MSQHDIAQQAQRLADADDGTRVRLHYQSLRAKSQKTATGTKVGSGTAVDAAEVDTGTAYDSGTDRIIRVRNGGVLLVNGDKQSQRLGMLQSVELPDDDDHSKITLEDADEVDWLQNGRTKDA